MDVKLYKNGWADIASGLNQILMDVIVPIHETIDVLDKMSKCDLEVRITGDYKGEYALMKDTLNNTLSTLDGYVNNISSTLDEMSNANQTSI